MKSLKDEFSHFLNKINSFKRVRFKTVYQEIKNKQIGHLRREFNRLTVNSDKKGPKMGEVRACQIQGRSGERAARLYIPDTALDRLTPGIVFFHGGGYILGNLDTHDGLCRRLAQASGLKILSIDYRLAPEHKFPAAIEDADSAVTEVLQKGSENFLINPDQLVLAGDSAGAGLAAVMAQEFKRKIKAQILLYPLLQLQDLKGPRQTIIRTLGGNLILSQICEAYLSSKEQAFDTRVSPLFQTDLGRIAPAFIISCGTDPLKLEAKVYAEHLKSTGVKTIYRHYKNMPHGFCTNTKVFPKGKKVIEEIGRDLVGKSGFLSEA